MDVRRDGAVSRAHLFRFLCFRPGVGARRHAHFDAYNCNIGVDPHAERPAVVGNSHDWRRARSAACRYPAFHSVGIFQLAVRLLAYTGVEKIGASRSAALQSVSPLVSAAIAIAFLGEPTTLPIILGTVLIVVGIILISWRPERQLGGFRPWHLLLPVGAAFLTGINHPIRRYVLTMANEPLFSLR